MFGEGFPTIRSCNISGGTQLPGIFYVCSSSCQAPQDSYLESHSESEFPASGPNRGEKRCERFDIYRCGLPMCKSNQTPKVVVVVVVVLVTQSCPTLCDPMDHARLLCPWDFPGKNTGVGSHFLLQGNLPDPGIELMSPALAGRFFTTEPPGKPAAGGVRVPGALKLLPENLNSLCGYLGNEEAGWRQQCQKAVWGTELLSKVLPQPQGCGSTEAAFWDSVSTSGVSATAERQRFCWLSALGVRSQTNLKPQKGVAKEAKYRLGYGSDLRWRAGVFCRPLPGSQQAELSLGYFFLLKGLNCFYSVS